MKHIIAWLIRHTNLKLQTGALVTTFAFPKQEICIGKYATGEIEGSDGCIPTYHKDIPESFSGMIKRKDIRTYRGLNKKE